MVFLDLREVAYIFLHGEKEDGLAREFYITFLDIFEAELCELFNNMKLANSQPISMKNDTVNQQILSAIKFGVSQNKVIYVNLAAIKFGISPRPVYAVYDRRICWQRQILAKTRNSPNSPNIIARQNFLI